MGAAEVLVERLQSVEWFKSVGGPCGSSVVRVKTWLEAVQLADAGRWGDVRNEEVNRLGLMLRLVDESSYNRWNQIVVPVKRLVEGLVVERIAPLLPEAVFAPAILRNVKSDVLGWAIEAEVMAIGSGGFFASLGGWYERGHFPCGIAAQGHCVKLVVF